MKLAPCLVVVGLAACLFGASACTTVTSSSRLEPGAPSAPITPGPGANSPGSKRSETALSAREPGGRGAGAHAGAGLGGRECAHCGR